MAKIFSKFRWGKLLKKLMRKAEIVQLKDTKQTAAEDLSKRLQDSRSFSGAGSKKGN